VAGYVSIRYTARSKALLAMERWRLTAAIEVAVARPSDGSEELFAAYMSWIHTKAGMYGAVPHWGQVHDVDATYIEQRYRDELETWRWALAEIENHGGSTFDSKFCRKRGLEATRGLDEYRASRSAGVLIASLVPLMF